jgi:hypothetical protein
MFLMMRWSTIARLMLSEMPPAEVAQAAVDGGLQLGLGLAQQPLDLLAHPARQPHQVYLVPDEGVEQQLVRGLCLLGLRHAQCHQFIDATTSSADLLSSSLRR